MAGYSLVDWICRGDRLATDSGRWRTAGTLFGAGFNSAGGFLGLYCRFSSSYPGDGGCSQVGMHGWGCPAVW